MAENETQADKVEQPGTPNLIPPEFAAMGKNVSTSLLQFRRSNLRSFEK